MSQTLARHILTYAAGCTQIECVCKILERIPYLEHIERKYLNVNILFVIIIN